MPDTPTCTIQVLPETKELLHALAQKLGMNPSDLLAKALKEYEREVFFRKLNEGYAALRDQPEEWSRTVEERSAWDDTLQDGIDPS